LTGTAQAEQPNTATASLPSVGTYTLDPPHTFSYFAAQHKIIAKVRAQGAARRRARALDRALRRSPASTTFGILLARINLTMRWISPDVRDTGDADR